MERPPRCTPVLARQIDRRKSEFRHLDEYIRGDIQELLKSESLTEELKTVKAVLNYMTLADPSPQSRETHLSSHGTSSGPSLNGPKTSLTPEILVKAIAETPQTLCIGSLTPLLINFDTGECPEMMLLRREIRSPPGHWPEYKKMAQSPGHIIYGLKVWMVDGIVYYSKRHKHETVLDDEEWHGLSLHLSSDLWTTLLGEVNDAAWDSFGYWTPLLPAGKDDSDWDLYWFLIHRNADYLWWILTGVQKAPEGRLHLHFQIEFDEELREE